MNWIPFENEDKLPHDREILVTVKRGDIYDIDTRCWELRYWDDDMSCVVAWMDYPKPYIPK